MRRERHLDEGRAEKRALDTQIEYLADVEGLKRRSLEERHGISNEMT